MSELSLLPSEPLLRQYTEVITALYRNITIEGNQASHFHLVVRDTESRMASRHSVLQQVPKLALIAISDGTVPHSFIL
ncbi:DUF905 family protein [Enterobacter roggenkampii]|uniref:DUF905 family protein n=1 Tax=Enterobacteriaceae TaxID=543 RepID=UPI000CFDC703|nr:MULTISPECIES: DUF905 family protein [Enterobacteriaceae]KAB0889657.1 DUF905 domain-containing protein [Cronobacter sakazakii]MBO4172658.1 DUF905 family protein [Enterobacter roggenkampii]MCK7352549.1 DUF905 family protein [Enterobacter roggenkampii]MCK7369882.1 DUF905 family protein [Enterobacter roggenkampii]UOY42332.1 DUF905 family protein [Enterobacter roggenkampii]